jgi:hypothetical protein
MQGSPHDPLQRGHVCPPGLDGPELPPRHNGLGRPPWDGLEAPCPFHTTRCAMSCPHRRLAGRRRGGPAWGHANVWLLFVDIGPVDLWCHATVVGACAWATWRADLATSALTEGP